MFAPNCILFFHIAKNYGVFLVAVLIILLPSLYSSMLKWFIFLVIWKRVTGSTLTDITIKLLVTVAVD